MLELKNILKIIRLYIIGFLCLVGFFSLEYSSLISDLVEFSENGRYGGTPMFFITGLIKYGLLIAGIGIILILTFLLIKQRIKAQ